MRYHNFDEPAGVDVNAPEGAGIGPGKTETEFTVTILRSQYVTTAHVAGEFDGQGVTVTSSAKRRDADQPDQTIGDLLAVGRALWAAGDSMLREADRLITQANKQSKPHIPWFDSGWSYSGNATDPIMYRDLNSNWHIIEGGI